MRLVIPLHGVVFVKVDSHQGAPGVHGGADDGVAGVGRHEGDLGYKGPREFVCVCARAVRVGGTPTSLSVTAVKASQVELEGCGC